MKKQFRAWDTVSRKMYEPSEIQIHFVSDGSYWVERSYNYGEQDNGFEMLGDDKKVKLLQYTGLQDKNGKEIYEGHVVRCGERLGLGGLLRQVQGDVQYLTNVASFGIEIPWEDGSVTWQMDHYTDFEVIGNIHENPELLSL